MKELDNILKKVEARAKELGAVDEEIDKRYKNWNKRSAKHLKILDEEDLESKLILLFEGVRLDGDLIGEGKELVDEIEENLCRNMEEVKRLFNSINYKINKQI